MINIEDDNFAYLIHSVLDKKIRYINSNVYNLGYKLFRQEDLDLITELDVTSLNNLNQIECLKNLKTIIIDNSKQEVINGMWFSYDTDNQFNIISDLSNLESLPNLEGLIIKSSFSIKKIDISNLKKLQKLTISNFPNLIQLNGLDELKNLSNIIITGTNIKNPIDYFKYQENTKNADVNILDIIMYLKMINTNKDSIDNIYFSEFVGQFGYTVLTKKEINKVYLKSLKFIKDESLFKLSKQEQIRKIYDFVVNTVEFDYKGLENRYNLIKKDKSNVIKYRDKFSKIHSSYNASVLGKSNCEGYVNYMRFILNILNIPSYNVHCKLADDESNYNNHSIIKIRINDEDYYFDPSLESIEKKDYYMKTYEEIKHTHSLGLFEQMNIKYNRSTKDGSITKEYYKK